MPEYEDHPSQKPEALMERIIVASSKPGDVVLDPFAGIFTTCCVAKRYGRISIGIELDEQYVKVGLRRMGFSDFGDKHYVPRVEQTFKHKNRPKEQELSLFAE
jgi:site-specific DNA-methyltransferase (adenine-specific)